MAKVGFRLLAVLVVLAVASPADPGNAEVNEAILAAFAELGVKAEGIRVRDVEFWQRNGPRLVATGRMVEGVALPREKDDLRLPLIGEVLRSPLAASGLGLACGAAGAPPPLSGTGQHGLDAGADPIPSDVEIPEVVRRLASLLVALEDAASGALPAEAPDARLTTWLIDGIDPHELGEARTEFERLAAVPELALFEQASFLVAAARKALAVKARWPLRAPLRIETARGLVIVGTKKKDVYEEDAWLLVDPGGNDVYRNNAGGTGTTRRAALCVDVRGDDLYESKAPFVQGAGWAGVGVLLDLAGNDRYRGAAFCQGVAVGGAGLLFDVLGRDVFDAQQFAQGAAAFGYGFLQGGHGDDEYALDRMGQGFGRTRGVGVLRDWHGNDRYVARKTHESVYSQWTGGRTVHWSFAQGCGLGFYARYEEDLPDGSKGLVIRDLIPGGIGALLEGGDGDDVYEGSMYAQGTAYFYGLGILADQGGNDTYRATWYGQGAAPHFACGILADGGGDDHYVGMHQVQGNGRDFATGVLLDLGGNDVYEAEDRVQGCGDRRDGYGVFVDAGGSDRYVAKGKNARGRVTLVKPTEQPTEEVPFADWGVFLDLGGEDVYEGEAGGGNEETWIQPGIRRGIGIDR